MNMIMTTCSYNFVLFGYLNFAYDWAVELIPNRNDGMGYWSTCMLDL